MAAHLQRALSPTHAVRTAASWRELLALLETLADEAIVVDPCVRDDSLGRRGTSVVEYLCACVAGARLVGYVSVTAEAMAAAVTLARCGATEIIIRGVSDQPAQLLRAVRLASASTLTANAIAGLEPALSHLPPPVALALRQVVAHPDELRTVRAVAESARVTRRSLDRWLARAGLAPARRFVACARAITAFSLLLRGGATMGDVAAALGVRSSRSLARELNVITGRTISELRRVSDTTAVVERIVGRAMRSAVGPSSAPDLSHPPSLRWPHRAPGDGASRSGFRAETQDPGFLHESGFP
jgi:hypothetical protein